MEETRQIFTLKQVVVSIQKTFQQRFHQAYWVKAEMHKLNRFASGHCFPELVYRENDQLVAQMRATIWKNDFDRINRNFIREVKESIGEGNILLLLVRIQFDPKYGVGLQILDIDPSFTLGELHREKQETLKRLQQENLLDANQKLPFPLLPKRLAIISAETSKGLSDFYQVLEERAHQYQFFTMLFQASLQGDAAVTSIPRQLAKIDKLKDHFDVVLIIRGGGEEVGMTCYNHYDLCSAIAKFPLPVLTGIGHSTNLNVAEMIAYRNAITPSALAQLLIHAFEAFEKPILDYEKSIYQLAGQLLTKEQHAFLQLTHHFHHAAKNAMKNQRFELVQQLHLFQQKMNQYLNVRKQLVINLEQQLVFKAMQFPKLKKEEMDRISASMLRHVKSLFQKHQERLLVVQTKVNLLSPAQILKRGYAIVRTNGKTVNLSNRAEKEAFIEIETLDFYLKSKVIELKPKKNGKN